MTDLLTHSFAMTFVFLILLFVTILIKLWLSNRQINFILAHQAVVPEKFRKQVTLSEHQKAATYSVAKLRLDLLDTGVGVVVLLGWTLFGGLQFLNEELLRVMPSGLWQQMVLVAIFSIIGAVIGLPLSLYGTFGLEQAFEFNKTTYRLWFVDSLKSILLSLIIGPPFLALILWVMQSASSWWWLLSWIILVAFNVLAMLIYPTWIAPLFNTFQPLDNEEIKTRISAFMMRCGFSAKGFFVMDGSKRSSHGNAYFTGLGPSKRVVFYDTLLRDLTIDEIEAILAHEIGHFKHKHVRNGVVVTLSIAVISLLGLWYVSGHTWFYEGLGVHPVADMNQNGITLILFMLTAPLFGSFITPLMAQFSRRNEFEADAYAAKKANATALSDALVKLYRDNASTLTPDPIYAKFYYSHPPAVERLAQLAKISKK
jgi:STE24 endopeptidase